MLVKLLRLNRLPALLWALAIVSSIVVLSQHAVPVFDRSALPEHRGHGALLLVHVVGGLAMLVFGATGLFIGWTRRGFRFHKMVGYSYLLVGALGAITALVLSIEAPHVPKSLYVATGTLAVVWLGVAAMALRAARNRRFALHRAWMIRSYVLSWTFVGCRLAESFPLFPSLGQEGITASIWVNWIVPLIVCELALQWRATAAPVQVD